jgi:hypothetical protein
MVAMMPQVMPVMMVVVSWVSIFSGFTNQPLKFEFIFIDIAKDSNREKDCGCQQSDRRVPHFTGS